MRHSIIEMTAVIIIIILYAFGDCSVVVVQGYRFYVLSSMPWLRNFDFSAVTKCEARTAETWKRLNNPNKKKKKIEATD